MRCGTTVIHRCPGYPQTRRHSHGRRLSVPHHQDMDTRRLRGAVTRAELISGGHTPAEIRKALRDGTLRALGPGICASPELWNEPIEARHRELALATVRKLRADHVLAGHSAAALHGLPLWGVNLRMVQLSLPVGHSASGSRNTQHLSVQRDPRPSAVMHVDGIACIRPARAIVDIARRASTASAVVAGDAALHRDVCTVSELLAELELVRGFPGYQRAQRAVAMMDARSESALESRSRVSMVEDGLPAPVLQHEIVDARGRFLARVDFAWPEQRVVGEADGMIKYQGHDLRAVLDREKHRGDRIAEQGWRVIRWSSADLDKSGLVVGRLRDALYRPRGA